MTNSNVTKRGSSLDEKAQATDEIEFDDEPQQLSSANPVSLKNSKEEPDSASRLQERIADRDYDEEERVDSLLSRQLTNATTFDIPDGGLWAWLAVAAYFIASFVCWGGNSAFAEYMNDYLTKNKFDGKPVDFAAIGGLAFGSGFLFCPFITYLVGLTSVNVVLFIGGLLQFLALMTASYCKELWQLYLSQGILVGVALSLISSPIPPVIPQWFSKRRSLAGGIASGGSGLGGIMFNLAMQKLTEEKSASTALRVQAIISIVLIMFATSILRTRGDRIKPSFKPIDFDVLKMSPFWLLIGFIIFSMFGYVATQYSLTNATVALGYSSNQGSIASALLNVGVFFGRPLAGLIADRLGAVTLATIIYGLCGVFTLAMWIPARNLATVYIYAIIIGGLMGYIWGALGAIIPRLVGLRKSVVTYGMVWPFIGASGIVSPIIGLALRKDLPPGVTKYPTQYMWCSLFGGVSFLVSAMCLFVIRAYVISRDQLDDEGAVEDQDYTTVRVPLPLVVKNLFAIRHHRKV